MSNHKRENDIIRLGVIGLGNIAQQHITNITDGHTQNCIVTAVCSRTKPTLCDTLNAEYFSDYQKLITSGTVDAVLIATPTQSHFEISKCALENNLHIMLEKPIGLSSYEGEQLIELQKSLQNKKLTFALMLNQRTDPTYKKIKEIVDSGILGAIQRTHWTMTNWFRPEIYFNVSDWRATWKGEGGGLLLNQCIHNLDIFQWICGVPSTITAFCEFGKYHNIEVEDEVTAYFRYNNKATGVFVGSTGEAPGVNRFDIIGDKGSLYFNNGVLTQTLNNQSVSHFCKTTQEMFGLPDTSTSVIEINEKVNQHAVVMNNFISSIVHNETLIASAKDGLASLDIANAILLSTWQEQSIAMPLKRDEYQKKLNDKVAHSLPRKKSNIKAHIDMNQSYR